MSATTIHLPEIPHLRTRYTLEARHDAHMPTHKGSLLRGAFGHALRRQACVEALGTACGGCARQRHCAYARVFEFLPAADRRAFAGGQPAAPRPYVFEALDERCAFGKGQRFDFDLLLFGEAVGWQAHAWLAVEAMARHGLGRSRQRFRLVGARALDAAGRWQPAADPRAASSGPALPVVARPEPRTAERATLRFTTPARIVHEGRLQREFSFQTVVEKALRRVFELAHFFTPEQPSWNFEPALALATEVEVVRRHTRWVDIPRYSNRQRRRMQLGGTVGEWTLEGPLTALTPLLQLAELVHVGKATVFGLGKVELAW